MKQLSVRAQILNGLYFVLVFMIALAIATLGLVRKINSYENNELPIIVHVDKEDIVVTNVAAGTIKKILVQNGQHVNKDDIIMELEDDATEAKISTLEKISSQNVSARTEALILKAQTAQNLIKAPRDGVIYKIEVIEGSYVNSYTPIIKMFADQDTKLTALVDEQQFSRIQKNRALSVYSPRLEESYQISLQGISRMIAPNVNQVSNMYEIHFLFADAEDSIALVEGEDLEILHKNDEFQDLRPATVLKRFWNSFILGN